MVRFLYILLCILFVVNSHGQDAFLIGYKSIKDSDTYMVGKDILYYSKKDSFSVYYEGENIFFDERISKDSVRFKSGNYLITDMHKNMIFFQTEIFDKIYKVKENIPQMNWQLTNETKEKDGIILFKAFTTFRGRNYTAWYNPEIPISVGPWKFNGLPGLTYEVYDDAEKYKFSWFLTYLQKSDVKKIKVDLSKDFIPINEYVDKLDYDYKNYKNMTDARLPEYIHVIESKITGLENYRQKKREIKYEWE